MKGLFSCAVLLSLLTFRDPPLITNEAPFAADTTENLFILTVDGVRWQEIFTGADPGLVADEKYTPDPATIDMLYGGDSGDERRKKLLPFFWNVIARKGQLYGNRLLDNKVNVANIYALSYPGYNEIFTGNTDITVSSNNKNRNDNINVLEYLNTKEGFKDKVAAFTSWDVFPYILNKERSGIALNSGYDNNETSELTAGEALIKKVEDEAVTEKTPTRHDQLTFLTAKEYLQNKRPRVVYIGLGETDEAAHAGRYDTYLEKMAAADAMIAALWHWIQTTPGYKNNSTLIITTDHGRGRAKDKWTSHGIFVGGSSQTWLAVLGPSIEPMGEIKKDQQLYQKQIAQTVAHLLGENFEPSQPVAKYISLLRPS